MNTLQLVFKELGHRKFNGFLSLLAVVTAVAYFVSYFTTGYAANRETRRLMRNLGYNLHIVHRDTDMGHYYTTGFSDLTMPHDHVRVFADIEGFSYAHLLATLHEKIDWNGNEAVLTGIAPDEVAPPDHQVPMMTFSITPGTVYLGYELARAQGVSKGDSIQVAGRPFTVEHCLLESGTIDDIRIYANLNDVQSVLGKEDQINEIQALECKCAIPGKDPLVVLREQLLRILPDTTVVRAKAIADARQRQREMAERYFAMVLPFVVLVCAIWIGALAMLNTRERRQEIGILRALGYGSGKIAGLFIGKAVVLGVVGAVIGFAAGSLLAQTLGPYMFEETAGNIKPMLRLLWLSIIVAPLFSALSSFIPAMLAVTEDPAETLREE